MTSLSAYVRVSMDKTGAGLGVANQRDAILKWAESNNHTITEWYEDNDISATSGKRRPGFEAMLADAPAELIVWHQDRLLRVTKDLEKILDKKMVVHQVTSGSLDLASPAGRAVARTIAAWTTYEGEQKAERMKLRNEADAKQGRTFLRRPVFGNELDGSLNTTEAEAIRKAAQDILDGNATMGGIANRWNEAGLLTPYSRSQKAVEQGTAGRGGNPWVSQTIKQLLGSERLRGTRTYRGKTAELAGWTPVLEAEQWEDLQKHLETLKTGEKWVKRYPATSQLLTGILSCSMEGCNRKLITGYASGGKRLYKCSTPKHGTKVAEPVEAEVIKRFLLALTGPEAQKKMFKESDGSIGRLRSERLALAVAHEEWMEEANGVLKPLRIAQAEAKHDDALRKLDAQILELDKNTLFEGLRYEWDHKTVYSAWQGLKGFEAEALERWQRVPLPRQRHIVESLFDRISVTRGKQGRAFKPEDVVTSPSALLLDLEAVSE